MIEADAFLHRLRGAGFGLVSGVPCSYLTPLINAAIDSTSLRYVNAANEGMPWPWPWGRVGWPPSRRHVSELRPRQRRQSADIAAIPYAIPMLLIVTWRGQPAGRGMNRSTS